MSEREVEFVANPGGQFEFVADLETPEAAVAGGMGSGKSIALAFVGVAVSGVNRGPWMWIAETSQQFVDNNIPPLQRQADILDIGMEVRTSSNNPVVVFEGLPMREEWAAEYRNVSGGNVFAMVRTAAAGHRVHGPNVTHGCADELGLYPVYDDSRAKDDAWLNLGFRVRLTPRDKAAEFHPIIRGCGTHQGKGTHLYRDFYGRGPNPLMSCPKCATQGSMAVVPGHTPQEQREGKTIWQHQCKACGYSYVGSRGYTASTYDNPHLTVESLNKMVARISPALIKPYLLGICVDIGSGKTAWEFTSGNLAPVKYVRGQPVYLCCDFNVAPMVWTLWQPCGGCAAHRAAGADGGWHAIAEFMHPIKAATQDMIADVIQWLRAHEHEWEVVVYGDRSGNSDDTRSLTTDYQIIYDALDAARFEWQDNVPESNPPIQNSVTIYNTQLRYTVRNPLTGEAMSGGCRILINPEACPQLVQDHEQSVLRNRSSGEGGGWTINKLRYDPHAMDGARYMIWVEVHTMGEVPEAHRAERPSHSLPEPSRTDDEDDDGPEIADDELDTDQGAFEAEYGDPWA